MRTIFNVTSKDLWTKALSVGRLESESLATEGFIHLSRPHQLLGVLSRHFKNQSDLILLQVHQELVTSEIKYEGTRDDKFPHIYGPLNIDSVIGVFELTGSPVTLPSEFSLVDDTLVRRAHIGDEAEITNVHTHAWQQSYKGIVPDEILAARPLSFRSRMAGWRTLLSDDTGKAAFVAESAQNGLIGFCVVEPARDQEFKGYGEISAIYCLDEFKKKGIGAELFRRGRRHLSEAGFKSIYLWVLKENPTCEFYRRMGGKFTGAEKTVELGRTLKEIVFLWT